MLQQCVVVFNGEEWDRMGWEGMKMGIKDKNSGTR